MIQYYNSLLYKYQISKLKIQTVICYLNNNILVIFSDFAKTHF